MRSRLLFAAVVGALLLTFGGLQAASAKEVTARPMACLAKGAGCQVMNGKNPEPKNDLCCSSHCNWDNGSQKYLCD